MKAEKIEDAHLFKVDLRCGKEVHEAYQAFINENYVLRTEEKTELDYINNKPISQI